MVWGFVAGLLLCFWGIVWGFRGLVFIFNVGFIKFLIMANFRVSTKEKGAVRLREKGLANGNRSLYLDFYYKGERRYEFLRLYLVADDSPRGRRLNRATLRVAESVRMRRLIEFMKEVHGRPAAEPVRRLTLDEWMGRFARKKKLSGQSPAYYELIMKTARHLKLYRPEGVALQAVDKEFCLGFLGYLKGSALSRTTAAGYFRCLNCALNSAARAEEIKQNPILKIDFQERIRIPESSREYLTREEIVKLVRTPCRNPQVKKAYMFGCMCALRLSDIRALRWGDIVRDGEQWRASILMIKTRRKLWLPLADEAVRWLPERGDAGDGDFIFQLPSLCQVNVTLRRWVKEAGIGKHITFHTSRHTHATLLLSLGVDLYTVSKLLGHSEVRSTQIYGRIVDRKKDEAVNLIPAFSLEGGGGD